MNFAAKIRSAIETLFVSHLVLQLRADLEEMQRQRDYFKARADRLELILLAPKTERPKSTAPPANTSPVGKKRWIQVQLEDRQRQLKEAAEKKSEGESHKVQS